MTVPHPAGPAHTTPAAHAVHAREPADGRGDPCAVAVAATKAALTRRSLQYKWLVIMVVLCGTASLASAAVLHGWKPLLALLLMPVAVMAFCVMDLHVVRRWRVDMLQLLDANGLSIDLLAERLQRDPLLPTRTLQGMLRSLVAPARSPSPRP